MTKEETPKALTITVQFGNGIEMEDNLNKAIDELSSVLKKKGLISMTLEGKHTASLSAMYKVDIQDNDGCIFDAEKINTQIEKLEYAKQRAIEFGQFLLDNYHMDATSYYHNDYQDKKRYTIDQLYELFNKEQP